MVTVRGNGFNQEAQIFLGTSPCVLVALDSDSELVCNTTMGIPGPVSVTVAVPGAGLSGPLENAYMYVFNIRAFSPSAGSIGGGIIVTVEGDGLRDGTGQMAQAALAIPGLETHVVGVYAVPQRYEVHDIQLKGAFVNEVQTVTLAEDVTYFSLSFPSRDISTGPMYRYVNAYVLQNRIASIMADQSQVRVSAVTSKTQPFTTRITIEFIGGQGDVEALVGTNCSEFSGSQQDGGNAASASNILVTSVDGLSLICSTYTPSGSITVVETVKGAAPSGNISLSLNGTTTGFIIPPTASALNMQTALQSSLAISGSVEVVKLTSPTDGAITWRITYLSYLGARNLPTVNSSRLRNGVITVSRQQMGTVGPSGRWRLFLGGQATGWLSINATEASVHRAVTDAWPSIRSVEVITADNANGMLINRAYPRQWAIRMRRKGVPGLGRSRCTNPTYIDWDPSVCPDSAADVFLAHFPW